MAATRDASRRVSVLDNFDWEDGPMGNTTTVTALNPPAQPSASKARKTTAVLALKTVKAALRDKIRRAKGLIKERVHAHREVARLAALDKVGRGIRG
jgi:hypothetical protein